MCTKGKNLIQGSKLSFAASKWPDFKNALIFLQLVFYKYLLIHILVVCRVSPYNIHIMLYIRINYDWQNVNYLSPEIHLSFFPTKNLRYKVLLKQEPIKCLFIHKIKLIILCFCLYPWYNYIITLCQCYEINFKIRFL